MAGLAEHPALVRLGVEPAPSKPEAFEAYIASESQKWAKVIRAADIKIE